MLGGVGTFEGPVLGAAAVGVMASGLPWVVLARARRSARFRDRARDREVHDRKASSPRGGRDMSRFPPRQRLRCSRKQRAIDIGPGVVSSAERRADRVGLDRGLRGRLAAARRAGRTPAGPIKMGIATDITGADRTFRQRQLAGGAVHRRADQHGRRHPRAPDRAISGGHGLGSEDRGRQRAQADPGAQGRRGARRHHQRDAPGHQGPDRQPRPHALHLPAALRRPGVHQVPVSAPARPRRSSATS